MNNTKTKQSKDKKADIMSASKVSKQTGKKSSKMTVQQLHQCIAKEQYEQDTLMKIADKFGLDESSTGTAHKIMHLMGQHCFSKNVASLMEIIHFDIDMVTIVPLLHALKNATPSKKKALQSKVAKFWEDQECEYCQGKKAEDFEETLGSRLFDLMEEEKIIFMNMGLTKYFVDTEEEDNYSSHATCAILIPQKNGYNMYYINSHGNDIIGYDTYETFKTKSRTTEIELGEPVDVMVMTSFVEMMKQDWDQSIHFEDKVDHVYYGVNLQAGDSISCCFIYPWIIYYCFGRYYDKKRTVYVGKKRFTLKAIALLIQEGKFEEAIQNMFIDFDADFKKAYLTTKPKSDSDDDEEKHMYDLENIIEVAGNGFVLGLINTVVAFMEQSAFASICE